MIIAIDVDGVVCDLMKPWLDRYNKDYDDNLSNESIKGWEIVPFVKKECGIKILDYIEDPTIYDDAPIISGSLEAINHIRGFGHRVIFVTASTIGHAGRKATWLKDHGFLFDKKNYVEAFDKSLIDAKVLIDDKYQNVYDFQQKGKEAYAYLFRQPWNNSYACASISDWNNFVSNKSFDYIWQTW